MADDYTSLCYRIVHYNASRSTHHKLALDGLVQIRGRMAERWRNLFLKHYEAFLEGAKAPDSKFQDFRNHVLHVRDGFWGGAVEAAHQWYERLVDLLQRHEWEEAAYAAGVLSHYYTDVIQPLHTQQSPQENEMHRAFEWSVFKSYDALLELIETKIGYPDLEAPETTDWLAQMIRDGARKANHHYDYIVDRFQLSTAVKDPANGLDRDMSLVIAELLAYATIGFSRILEKAFEESEARPPRTIAALTVVVATIKSPIHFVARCIHDVNEREIVLGIHEELQETGAVEETLPEDDRVVARLYHREVLGERRPSQAPEPAMPRSRNARAAQEEDRSRSSRTRRDRTESRRPEPELAAVAASPETPAEATEEESSTTESPRRRSIFDLSRYVPGRRNRDEQSTETDTTEPDPTPDVPSPRTLASSPRFYLQRTDHVERAPSIGPKTARRLEKIGVHTVDDLLMLEPQRASAQLNVSHIDPDTLRDWQKQATLVCRVPNLRGHDAQILVACGYNSPQEVAAADAEELLLLADEFADSHEGQRVLRGGLQPSLDEISNWIRWAGQARTLQAAA